MEPDRIPCHHLEPEEHRRIDERRESSGFGPTVNRNETADFLAITGAEGLATSGFHGRAKKTGMHGLSAEHV